MDYEDLNFFSEEDNEFLELMEKDCYEEETSYDITNDFQSYDLGCFATTENQNDVDDFNARMFLRNNN